MMLAKLLWLIPLIVLVALLCIFTLASMFPLSELENYVGYGSGYKAGFSGFTFLLSIPFFYLLVWCALLLFPQLSVWLRGVISLVVALLIVGWTVVNGYAAAVGAAGGARVTGGDELMLPVVLVEKVLFFVTGPVRANHYIAHLEDADPAVRERAVSAAYMFVRKGRGKNNLSYIRSMAKAFSNSSNEDERTSLASSLAASETNDREALLTITAVLKSPDAICRAQAADLLGELEPALPEIVEALMTVAQTDPDYEVRYHVGAALARIVPEEARLEALLLAAIERGEPWGARVLYLLNTQDPRVAAAFVCFLKDNRPAVLCAWLDAALNEATLINWLMQYWSHGPMLRATMLKLMHDADRSVRAAAIKAAARVFTNDTEALLIFIEALSDSTEEIRYDALSGIRASAARDPRIARALLRALMDSDPKLRFSLAQHLLEFDLDDPQIQLGVVAVIRDNTDDVDFMLTNELAEAKPQTPAVLAALAELLKHRNPWVRFAGAKILGFANVQDARIQVMLVRQLTDTEGDGMDRPGPEAAEALASIHPLAPETVAALKRLAQGSDESIAETARDLLKPREP
jgi:HEAT repeat protein